MASSTLNEPAANESSSPNKEPSAASDQKPSSKPATATSDRKPPREPQPAMSDKPPSKTPSAASTKPQSKPPTAASERKPPSKPPSATSEHKSSASERKSSSKQRKDHTPSLQSSGHPFPRRNTHLGHHSASRMSKNQGPRSRSLPPVNSQVTPRNREPTVASSIGPPLAAGTPRASVAGSAGPPRKLEPLPSHLSGSQQTLAGAPVASRQSLRSPERPAEDGRMMGSQRFLDQIVDDDPEAAQGDPRLPREKYFGSTTSLRSKREVKPLPEIKELKEPKHPRNKFIVKKIGQLEEITRKLREGPWDGTPSNLGLQPKKQVVVEGPYTLDDVVYEDDEEQTVPWLPTLQPETVIDAVKRRFVLPSAFDPETGQINEEIARAAAIVSAATTDPTESSMHPDPSMPNVCSCCESMNEHNRHLADTERQGPRPRVVQAKELEKELGEKGVDATGYYRSDSPVLIPVENYMDRDVASEELLKVGVAKEMVEQLKQIAKPHALPANQVPWPFYAHDMATTADLSTYLETGLPTATDAIIQVNVGEATSKYKDSMDRLEKLMRKF